MSARDLQVRAIALVLSLVVGCDGRAPLAVDDGGGAAELSANPCSCSFAGTAVSGAFDGAPLDFADAQFGVETTWGSHAEPLPCPVLGLRILMRTRRTEQCWRDEGQVTLRTDLSAKLGERSFSDDLIEIGGGYAEASGRICLSQLPVAQGDPGDCFPEGLGMIRGCVDLVLRVDGTVKGTASGPFEAAYCSSLNMSGGE